MHIVCHSSLVGGEELVLRDVAGLPALVLPALTVPDALRKLQHGRMQLQSRLGASL